MTAERRTADRRVSPAVGELAIQRAPALYAAIDRLRQELAEARAQSTEDHAAMLAALGESMRLREVNAELVAILRDWRATALDVMDEEFEPWVAAFAARVNAAIAKATEAT